MKAKRILSVTITAALLACLASQVEGQRGRRGRRTERDALKVGQLAPTFKLKSLDGEDTFDLKKHRGEKPVILFFGSYT